MGGSQSNTHTKWSSNKSDPNLEKDDVSLQTFNEERLNLKNNKLNLSQPQQNTFSHSTIKSFKSKQSLKQKIKDSMKMIKEQDFLKGEKSNKNLYSLSLMRNLVGQESASLNEKRFVGRLKNLRGKSTEILNSKKEIFWKVNETVDKEKKQLKIENDNQMGWKLDIFDKLKANQGTFKKKKIRYSLNESKKQQRNAKNVRDRLLNQLLTSKQTSQLAFPSKKYHSNIQSEILGKTVDSTLVESQHKSKKSLKLKTANLKFKRKTKEKKKGKEGKADRKKLKKGIHSKREKKGGNPKQKFLEFQKRKIEKEIRSFHSLEPSSISNNLNKKKDKSVQSNIKNDVIGSLNNIYQE